MPLFAHPQRLDWRDAAIAAADTAAQFIAQEARSHRTLAWEEKSATDFVSRVDIGAEERIRDIITARIPGIRMVGEELTADARPDEGVVAIVDPLDGTTNFLHGFPNYGVSICIAVDGVPQAGVVHDVARGGVLYATAGDGAFVDGNRLLVSTTDTPARALIGTGIPFKDVSQADHYLRQLRRLMPIVSGVRRAGSAALDLSDVARGRFDAFWELFLNPWDLAAGVLLVREAGGRVTDLEGRDAKLTGGPIVASNGILHEWFLGMLTDADVSAPYPA
jgi:myo-inositol-1(or 4)-monophosphatase